MVARQAGERAEVRAAEVRHLGGLPAVQAVALGHRAEDPDVHRERLEPTRTEEQHTVGDLLAHAWQRAETLLRRGIGHELGLLEPAGMGSEEDRGLVDEPRAKAEQAVPQRALRDGRERFPRGKRMTRWLVPRAMPLREQREHLLDLHDLLPYIRNTLKQGLKHQIPTPKLYL